MGIKGGINSMGLIFCALAVGLAVEDNKTLSDVYVNLPATCATCRKVHYQLSAFNGCYRWTTFNPQIIALEEVRDSEECSSRAVISASVSTPLKTVVIVKATDVITKEPLISQVKVSKIARIKIRTNFKAIDVDDVQKLYIQAFDENKNVISSVEGLRFEWKIETNQPALKIIASNEANYENSPVRLEMEGRRLQTDLVLVRGMQTGVVEVSARIVEKEYESVGKARIVLSVIEPFCLIPDKPIYLLTQSEFLYRVAKGRKHSKDRMREKRVVEVQLPDKQYHFVPSEGSMLITKDSGLVQTKDKLGEVLVRVEDTTLANNTVEGLIFVVDPDVIELSIRDITAHVKEGASVETLLKMGDVCETSGAPGEGVNNWNLVVDHVYVVTSCLQDFHKNLIEMTLNIGYNVEYDKGLFQFVGADTQRSIMVVKAVKSSYNGTSFRSTLVLQKRERRDVYAQKDARILSQVRIRHPTPSVLLPYLGRRKLLEAQMYTLEAVGGSGAYHWDSRQSSVVSVNNYGTVFGLRLGSTRAFAYDALNRLNNDSIEVEVSRIGKLEWLESKLELPVHTSELLSAISLDVQGRKFTNCTSVPLDFRVKDDSIIHLKEDKLGRSYNAVRQYVTGERKSLVKLRHHFDLHEDDIQDVSRIKLDEWVELHNQFGICGQISVGTLRKGMGRVQYSVQVEEEDGAIYKRESEYAHVLSYKPLRTVGPNYEQFLQNLKQNEKDMSHKVHIHELKSETEFVLGFGSGLLWEVEGGTSRWPDLPRHYFEEVTAEPVGDSEGSLGMKRINGETVQGERPHYFIECPVPEALGSGRELAYSYKPRLRIGNRRARSLLRPAVNTLSIDVFCQLPQLMHLAWAQKEVSGEIPKYESFPKKEGEGEPDTYYVRNEQLLHIRTLVFDKFKRLFYNFTSYGRKEISTDAELGTVAELQPYYMHSLELSKKMGTFLVRGNLIALPSPATGKQLAKLDRVWDSMRINSVNLLQLEPEYKLLYLDPRNKFEVRVLYGSGIFGISTNHSGIVETHYDSKTSPRSITIVPQKEGYVKITVEDLGVANTVSASCTILISDVHRISLEQDLLMEQDTSSKLKVTYFALNGEEFSTDQYPFVPLRILQERKRGSIKGVAASEDPRGLDIFTEKEEVCHNGHVVIAKELGHYEVIASANKRDTSKVAVTYTGSVLSNPIYIEVFPHLEVKPKKLLLLPDGSYTVKVVGGPASLGQGGSPLGGTVSRQFLSENTDIAVVDPFNGEVTGLKVGLTAVHVVVAQELKDRGNRAKYVELCKKSIPVSVQLATEVEIAGAEDRPLVAGSVVRLLAVLKHNKEPFTFGVFPVEYHWTSKQFHVFSLQSSGKSGSVSTGSISTIVHGDQLAITGKAHKVGEAEVWAYVNIKYPELYRGERHEFNVSTIVHVIDPLHGKVPTFAETDPTFTATYLIPPKCIHKLPSDKEQKMKLSYASMCGSSGSKFTPVSVSEEGTITSSDQFGSATVLVEDNSPIHRLRSAYYVEVAPVNSVIMEHSAQILTVPLGADVEIRLTSLDRYGRAFAHGVEGLKVETDLSHPRVLHAELDYYNGTLNIRSLALGTSNIHIYFSDSEFIFDLVKVHVSSVIEPVAPVFAHVGGTVQFRTSTREQQGKWGSEDPSVMEIDPKSGLGKCKGEGSTNVYLQGTIHLSSSVTCGRVKHLAVEMGSAPAVLTNIESHRNYKHVHRVQFRVFPDDSSIDITPDLSRSQNLINHNIHFECKSLNPAWVLARSEQDETKGQAKSAVCLLFPKSGSMAEMPPSTVSIQVSAGSLEFGYMKEEVVSFPYVSAFKALSSKQLMFTKNERSKTVKVAGSSDIKVWMEDPTLADIRTMPSGAENIMEVTVSIPYSVTHSFENARLRIENSLTGQTEEFMLSYDSEKGVEGKDSGEVKEGSGGWPVVEILTVIILVVTVVIFLRTILWNNGEQNGAQVNRNAYPYPRHGPPPGYRTPAMQNAGVRGIGAGGPFRTPLGAAGRTPMGTTDPTKNIGYRKS